jgi:uncharacterized membrane protein YoaK (UPF0700 family)
MPRAYDRLIFLKNGNSEGFCTASVHTTYLTGMITSLVSREAEKLTSEVVAPPFSVPDPKIDLLLGIWIAFVLGAVIGAAIVLRCRAFGMLGAALVLVLLILRNSMVSQAE